MPKSTTEDVKILENRYLGGDNYYMTVESQGILKGEIVPEIGQFYMLKLTNEATLLRRPISISYVDFEKGVVEFLYKVFGKGTQELSHLVPGDTLNIQGPLGHGFEIKDHYRNCVIVGAGIGLAPLKFLIEALLANGNPFKRHLTFIMGARDIENLRLVSEFDLEHPDLDLIVCTDDGSLGQKSNVVAMLKQFLGTQGYDLSSLGAEQAANLEAETAANPAKPSSPVDIIYSCGPHIVLDLITDLSNELGIESQVSMEERMACGIGACVGCSVKTPNGMRKVCKDGPVMYSHELKQVTCKCKQLA